MTKIEQDRKNIRAQVFEALRMQSEEGAPQIIIGAQLVEAVLILGELVECAGVALARIDGQLADVIRR